jgi:hypothetical protein
MNSSLSTRVRTCYKTASDRCVAEVYRHAPPLILQRIAAVLLMTRGRQAAGCVWAHAEQQCSPHAVHTSSNKHTWLVSSPSTMQRLPTLPLRPVSSVSCACIWLGSVACV